METVSGIIISIIVAMIIAALTPVVAAYGASAALDRHRKGRAKKRIDDEPHYKRGVILEEIRVGGNDKTVCGRCYIYSIILGRIEVRMIDENNEPRGKAMSWTLEEFEKFDPVVQLTKNGHPVFKIKANIT